MSWLIGLNRRFWPLLTAALLATVTALSLSPLPELPLPDVASSDKLHHFVAYGALALPVALARPRGWVWWIAGMLAWSGAIELIQPYVNRQADWGDFFANAGGLAAGVAVSEALRRVVRPA